MKIFRSQTSLLKIKLSSYGNTFEFSTLNTCTFEAETRGPEVKEEEVDGK